MNLYYLICFIAILCYVTAQPLSSSNEILENMSDLEIAQMVKKNTIKRDDTTGDIIYPTSNETWHVGQEVNVTFEGRSYDSSETISIFIFERTGILAGGPLNKHVFPFTVPSSAYTGPDDTALLLAVKRKSLYLQSVISIVLHIVK